MIFEFHDDLSKVLPLSYQNISDKFGEDEKKLEDIMKELIGSIIFPDVMVFGNQRAWQKEADIFAVGINGELIVIELKVKGQYDRSKVLQAMEYSQIFSKCAYIPFYPQFIRKPFQKKWIQSCERK